MTETMQTPVSYEYDVCLSFAGEQRSYVDAVAHELHSSGVRVFHDDLERVSLWGKDLYEHLDWVYRRSARYCVLFVSADYARKVWTNHERSSAQARAVEETNVYILPVRFDDTEVPGLRSTVDYIDLTTVDPPELARLVRKKLDVGERRNFLPPILDKLHAALDALCTDEQDAITAVAQAFMRSLQRMTPLERKLVAEIFKVGCPAELPKNMHVSLDLIRRDIGVTPVETLETLRGLRSVGFVVDTRESEDGDADDEMVVIEWHDFTVREPEGEALDLIREESTNIAHTMLNLAGEYCLEHTLSAVEILDFSALSSATS